MLAVKNLLKCYDKGKVVLDEVSFEILPHSFTAILGPSGAGKTTLMRCILLLNRPDRGEVWFKGKNLTKVSSRQLQEARSKIGTISQQFNLVPRRSALENCLGGRLRELSLWQCLLGKFPKSLLIEGMQALDRVQLLDFAFERADRLSGGQKQRVAIARALTQGAELILADEPVASLDPETAHLVLRLLRSLCELEGLTVVCNLHQVELAKQYSDRIMAINGGKLILDLPSSEFTSRDADLVYRR